MTVTIGLGEIIIGVVMFIILGLMIYAQGRVDEMRSNGGVNNLLKAAESLSLIYFQIASEVVGAEEVRRRRDVKINQMMKEIENEYR